MNSPASDSLVLFQRLASLHRALAAPLDFEKALGLIASSGVQLVGAASCLVLLREEKEVLRICAAQGVDPAAAARFVGAMKESTLGELPRHLGFAASHSVSAAPIMSDQVVRGVLVVIRDAPLNPEETWLLTALADQAGISLTTSHVHETLISQGARLRDEVERSRKTARETEASIHSVARDLRRQLAASDPASGAVRMEALIQDLLDYSRFANAVWDLEAVDLEGAVLEALARIEAEMKSRGAIARVESSPLNVLAHRKTLVTILVKLLSNAMRLVGPGEKPLLVIKAERVGTFVRVSARSNGRGISEAFLSRVFAMDGSPDPAEGGPDLGIGPAIVQRGVERMGGRCGAESEAGQGSRFWIELPGA